MLFNRINVSALDRIIINSKDVIKIKEAIDTILKNPELKEKIMELDLPFDTKGIISYEVTSHKLSKVLGRLNANFYFNLANPKGLEINGIEEDGTLLYRVILDVQADKYEYKAFQKNNSLDEHTAIEMAKRVALVLLDFMKYTQYMGYMKQNSTIVVKRAVVKNKSQGTTKKPTKDNRAVVSVSKPKKIYNYEEAQREGEKRNYERHTESWEVVGHWRHYKKSDKRVFVKGYKKGEGKKKGKDYTV